MSPSESFELFIELQSRIDTLWNFLLTVHIALVTGLFLSPVKIGTWTRLIILIVYGFFMVLNHNGFVESYELHIALHEAITTEPSYAQSNFAPVIEAMLRHEPGNLVFGMPWEDLIHYVHPIISVPGAIVILFFGRTLRRDARDR